MSALIRYASLRRLQVVLGLALMGLVFAPGASGAAQLDTVTVTGSSGIFSDINMSARSGTSGQNLSGTVSLTLNTTFGSVQISGTVTCLSVTGADQGGGTPQSPTTAVFNAQTNLGILITEAVDKGGNGLDQFTAYNSPPRTATDCSPVPFPTQGLNGRATVFDAPLLPTSKDQCKNGGWLNYPQFKNQGDCVSFVENGK
jgi:hypothetical protein